MGALAGASGATAKGTVTGGFAPVGADDAAEVGTRSHRPQL